MRRELSATEHCATPTFADADILRVRVSLLGRASQRDARIRKLLRVKKKYISRFVEYRNHQQAEADRPERRLIISLLQKPIETLNINVRSYLFCSLEVTQMRRFRSFDENVFLSLLAHPKMWVARHAVFI